jgi:hypothetical protein
MGTLETHMGYSGYTGTVDSHGYSGCSYRSLRPGYSGVLTCGTRGYSNGLAAEERRKQMAFCFGLKSLAASSDVVPFARDSAASQGATSAPGLTCPHLRHDQLGPS